jgi:hypothetical protein
MKSLSSILEKGGISNSVLYLFKKGFSIGPHIRKTKNNNIEKNK